MNEQQTTHTKSIEEMIDEVMMRVFVFRGDETPAQRESIKNNLRQAMRELVGEVLGEIDCREIASEIVQGTLLVASINKKGLTYKRLRELEDTATNVIQSKLTQLKGGQEHE